MGIAMTFARASGPGDLRTRRRGPRGDDGVQGREPHRGHDARRRSRDVGKLRRKSRTAVYRNVEMVFPFVLRQLGHGYMTKEVKNNMINRVIYYGYWGPVYFLFAYIWYLWSDPLFLILGLTEELANYGWGLQFLIICLFLLPMVLIAHVFFEKVVTKLYKYDE